ncbi:FAD-binding protein, partial [Aerococcus urinae]
MVSSEAREGDGPSLTEAAVVVCGGRGTNGDFSLVNQMASTLGGAVGATRVAADEGWVDRAIQIGQTGETVA